MHTPNEQEGSSASIRTHRTHRCPRIKFLIALIQRRNAPFFGSLGWSAIGAESDFRGTTHQEMEIALAGAEPGFAPGGYAWAYGV